MRTLCCLFFFISFSLLGENVDLKGKDRQQLAELLRNVKIDKKQVKEMIFMLEQSGQIDKEKSLELQSELKNYRNSDLKQLKQKALDSFDKSQEKKAEDNHSPAQKRPSINSASKSHPQDPSKQAQKIEESELSKTLDYLNQN